MRCEEREFDSRAAAGGGDDERERMLSALPSPVRKIHSAPDDIRFTRSQQLKHQGVNEAPPSRKDLLRQRRGLPRASPRAAVPLSIDSSPQPQYDDDMSRPWSSSSSSCVELTSPSLQSLAKNQLTLARQIDKALSLADSTTSDLPPLKPFHHRLTTPSQCPPPESPVGPGLTSQTDTTFLRKKLSQSNIAAAVGPGGIDFDAGARGTFRTESVLDLGIEEDCNDTLVQMNHALNQLQAWKQAQQVKEAELVKVAAAQQQQKEESSDVNEDRLATTDGFASFEDGGYYSGASAEEDRKKAHGLEIADQCILDLMKRRREHCEARAAQRQELDKAKMGAASNPNPGLLQLQSDLLGLKLKEFGLQATDAVGLPTGRPPAFSAAEGIAAGTLEMDKYDLEGESWDRFVTEEEKGCNTLEGQLNAFNSELDAILGKI